MFLKNHGIKPKEWYSGVVFGEIPIVWPWRNSGGSNGFVKSHVIKPNEWYSGVAL